MSLLQVQDLSVIANNAGRDVTLVDRVSFDLAEGEILGLVGESGSGKTMACRGLMRLLPSSNLRVQGGAVRLAGQDLLTLDDAGMRAVRGGQLGMIFQNPSSHLDPLMRIGEQIAEGIRLHQGVSKKDARLQAIDVLRQVGIPDPQARVDNYPHEFSGGMRQRAMIAVALGCNPKVLIADEPTTALDVTVQAQILRLLLDLRDSRGLSIIMITHDLGVVAQTCDSIAVMYAGRLCEHGSKYDLLAHPRHPYTAGLIDCQPAHSSGHALLRTIPGQPPLLDALPVGCRFNPRCPQVGALCTELLPEGARVACHYPLGARP
ncbi:ABC transporter ATP-binding protein [Pseudomonas costantinii]|uniref:ABC-type dipeptide transporter n=1 Tax=Pseudomonas costantinii TaxID=168469 RepID=A0A1S2V4A6_9PSED|nr:ABC transporter ATP-binding protein [Pseudomonas costantinii]NVZ21682.1 ABC transporter ATP-binding protein [Pseudomonas costantinii]OIN53541.1 methionine ABC transporter ATP-binding protein [Pseudomonas costantinii]SEE35634.1 peptide/nickel transport system ATP-binding protein [Pseudomonas costantinii]